ncbi:MAG: branched-chain-amino-acid transaminase [Fibrobacterota bacterium]|jgi:branched-chain amino acid aminotransferase
MPRYAYVDGRYLPEDQATIPVLDRGLMLGDGIFETVRAKHGAIEFFEGHFARFCRSAELVRMRQPFSQGDLEAICAEICRLSELADASVRFTLTRGPYRGTLSDTGDAPRLIATCSDAEHVDPKLYVDGVSISVASFPRAHAIDPSIKATQYLPAVLARLEADAQGCYESLFLDGRGRILELSSATFFAVRFGQILTPPLRLGILAGVTRSAILRLAKGAKLPAAERILNGEDIKTFDEAFLTSAVRGVMPIVRIAGIPVGTGAPGPVTRQIMELFREETGRK